MHLFFVHHYTNRFIFSKQRSFADFFSPAISVNMAGVNSISSLLSDDFSWAMTSSICPNRTSIFFIRRSRFRSTVFRQTHEGKMLPCYLLPACFSLRSSPKSNSVKLYSWSRVSYDVHRTWYVVIYGVYSIYSFMTIYEIKEE